MKLLHASPCLFLLSPVLYAQSLAQREMIVQDKTQVAEHAKETNQKCGTSIAFTVDYSTFADVKTAPENTNQQSPYAFAENVNDALDSICGSDDGKASVKAKIKSVRIIHAKTEAESLNGGVFTYTVPYTGATVQTVQDYLKSKL